MCVTMLVVRFGMKLIRVLFIYLPVVFVWKFKLAWYYVHKLVVRGSGLVISNVLVTLHDGWLYRKFVVYGTYLFELKRSYTYCQVDGKFY